MKHLYCSKCGNKLIQIWEIKNGYNTKDGTMNDSYFRMRCPNYKYFAFTRHDEIIVNSQSENISWYPYY